MRAFRPVGFIRRVSSKQIKHAPTTIILFQCPFLSIERDSLIIWSRPELALHVFSPVQEHLTSSRDLNDIQPAQLNLVHTFPLLAEMWGLRHVLGDVYHGRARASPRPISDEPSFFYHDCKVIRIIPRGLRSPEVKLYSSAGSLGRIFAEISRSTRKSYLDLSISGNLILLGRSDSLLIMLSEDSVSVIDTFRNVHGSPISNEIPFICPITGVVGCVGVRGDIHVWRQH